MSDAPSRPRLTDPDCPTSVERAIPVRDVSQEYSYVGALQCSCGATGSFEVNMQALTEHGGSKFDMLDCICSRCRRRVSLYFNVDEVFAGYAAAFGGAGGEDEEAPPADAEADGRVVATFTPGHREAERKRAGCLSALLPVLRITR